MAELTGGNNVVLRFPQGAAAAGKVIEISDAPASWEWTSDHHP